MAQDNRIKSQYAPPQILIPTPSAGMAEELAVNP
jgi:hypothetical protein